MAGSVEGGKKSFAKVMARDPLHYKRIGHLGGKAGAGEEYQIGGSKASGFAAHPELAPIYGAIGGKKSKRGPNKKVQE